MISTWFKIYNSKVFTLNILKINFKIPLIFCILSPNLTHRWPYKFNRPHWPYHSLSDQVFFFEDILHLYVNDHTTVLDRGFSNLVCETMV